MQRYHRQTVLTQVGKAGQEKLLNSRVLIVGAGGLGHPAAQYLAGAGVGQIEIVDGDKVQVTNLHRQILFEDKDIGKNKAEILAERISEINQEVKVSSIPHFLDKPLALDLFGKFDLVLDCTDNFAAKFLINDVCALYDKPMIYGAISQFDGQVGVFWKSKGACYRCMYRDIPKAKIQNCAEAGVVGPVVGVMGSLQALEAMKVLIGSESGMNPLIGRVNYYDFCDHSFRSLQVPLRHSCTCHSSSFNQDQIPEIKIAVCQSNSSATLVDVRELDEWEGFHLDGSYSCPLSELEGGVIPNFKRDQELILICKSGFRAKKAMEIFVNLNFTNVHCSERGVYEY